VCRLWIVYPRRVPEVAAVLQVCRAVSLVCATSVALCRWCVLQVSRCVAGVLQVSRCVAGVLQAHQCGVEWPGGYRKEPPVCRAVSLVCYKHTNVEWSVVE